MIESVENLNRIRLSALKELAIRIFDINEDGNKVTTVASLKKVNWSNFNYIRLSKDRRI